jgi:pyruvate dehydrogenase E1 component alpha subunit
MTQEMAAAKAAADAASPALAASPAPPQEAGSHALRHQSLYPAEPAAISREEGLMLYRDMQLGRRFEDKCAEMYYRGKMFGFVHLYNGQEAVSTGVIKAMRLQHDWFCSTYRDHVHALSCGVPAREVMSELFGKATGCSKGRGGSMHLFSKEHHLLGGYAFIGEGIPVALGAAFTSRYKRDALGEATSDSHGCVLRRWNLQRRPVLRMPEYGLALEAADPLRGREQPLGHRDGPQPRHQRP